jgi:hypothetical protein
MKPGKTKYINIDTRFKDDYDTEVLSKHTINLPERYTEVRNISIVNAEIPMSYYNISSTLGNNSFELLEDSVSELIVVPDDEYTMDTLVAKINELITLTHTAIAISTKTIITHTVADSHTIIKIDFTKDEKGNRSRFGFKSSLGWLLGFREPVYTFSETTLTTFITSGLTSTALVSIVGPRYLYLVVDEFTTSGNQSSFVSPLPSSLINKNILARISISKQDYPFGSVMPANLTNGLLMSDVRSYTGKVDIQKLNVQLVNEFGNVINLNGDDFSFCLKIEHE